MLPGVSSAAASIPYLTKRDVWFELCFAQVLSQETKARHQDARQGGQDNAARREDQDLREGQTFANFEFDCPVPGEPTGQVVKSEY